MLEVWPIWTVMTVPAGTSAPSPVDWLMALTPLPLAPVAFMMSPALAKALLASAAERPSTLGTRHSSPDFSAPM